MLLKGELYHNIILKEAETLSLRYDMGAWVGGVLNQIPLLSR